MSTIWLQFSLRRLSAIQPSLSAEPATLSNRTVDAHGGRSIRPLLIDRIDSPMAGMSGRKPLIIRPSWDLPLNGRSYLRTGWRGQR